MERLSCVALSLGRASSQNADDEPKRQAEIEVEFNRVRHHRRRLSLIGRVCKPDSIGFERAAYQRIGPCTYNIYRHIYYMYTALLRGALGLPRHVQFGNVAVR
jgi:hypothetical protein